MLKKTFQDVSLLDGSELFLCFIPILKIFCDVPYFFVCERLCSLNDRHQSDMDYEQLNHEALKVETMLT